MNEILLRRKHKLNIEDGGCFYDKGNLEPHRYIIAIAKNVESLGFRFDVDVIDVLKTYSVGELKRFYNELIPMLQKLCAADVEYKPMYPNFPKQVASASDAELFVNAFFHYMTYGSWLPEYAQNVRMPLVDSNKMTVLSLGTVDDIYDIFANLVSSKTSLSEQDKEDVEDIMINYPGYENHMPDDIPLKENVAMVANYMLKINPHANSACIAKYFKTATDVLRFIVSVSGGDISLASRTQYKHLCRPERRLVMDLLAKCGSITEDLFRYRDEWIRIGEIIHPWEYTQSKYMAVREAFNVLRNEEKPLFTMGRVEEYIKVGDVVKAATLLTERPGEYARRLDKLLRDSHKECRGYILKCFEAIADKVSTPVLFQVRQNFISRIESNPNVRVFMPKGNVAKAISIPYNLPEIDVDTCEYVIKICNHAIANQYKQRDHMGCVYIDPDFKNYIVPFSQRSASGGNKILVRGSRVPIKDDTSTIRAFIWWTNKGHGGDDWRYEDGRVDIDLSACVLDDQFRYMNHISYTNLRSNSFKAYHSGDITNGGSVDGKGVAEFIDVDIDSVVRNGGRYICYQVYSFTRQKFKDLPNCRFGWMEREDPNSGEIFEPKTVEMAITLNSDSTVSVPVLFDCIEKKFIWMDMNVQTESFRYGNNIESNISGVRAVAYAIVNINKTNLYDLVYLNAIARGCVVDDRNMADIIFSNDITKPVEPIFDDVNKHIIEYKEKDTPIVTAFDTDYFMGKLL